MHKVIFVFLLASIDLHNSRYVHEKRVYRACVLLIPKCSKPRFLFILNRYCTVESDCMLLHVLSVLTHFQWPHCVFSVLGSFVMQF